MGGPVTVDNLELRCPPQFAGCFGISALATGSVLWQPDRCSGNRIGALATGSVLWQPDRCSRSKLELGTDDIGPSSARAIFLRSISDPNASHDASSVVCEAFSLNRGGPKTLTVSV